MNERQQHQDDRQAPADGPRVQIGLPVYNGENFLAPAIESLLAQTFTDFELLISDNGSTDGTEAIGERFAAADPRVKYYRYDENRGAAWNFNNAFHLSSAPYFKWAAHDDLHEPEYVERCLALLESTPEVGLCYTATRYVDADGRAVPGRPSDGCHLRQPHAHERLRGYFGTFPMHVLFGVARREVLSSTRLWGAFASADRVLVSELALAAQIHEIAEPLFVRRFHDAISWFPDMSEKDYAAWYDPRNAEKFAVPVLQRGVEYAKGVHHAPVSGLESLRCYGEVLRYASWDHGVLRARRYARAVAHRLRPERGAPAPEAATPTPEPLDVASPS
jgi:glycosyltransferase involved in cell wall biosynthesis